ncbi:MAG: signal peptide peptidase SppA [Sedimentisphaerales bacterium]|nr:signal peptide peptidase SppA [Sedimentisphaerales bacterium]
MDYENNSNFGQAPSPAEPNPPSYQSTPMTQANKPRKRTGWKILLGIFVALSVLANIILFLALIGMFAVFATGQRGIFTEEVIQTGPKTAKIAVIALEGLIDAEKAEEVYTLLKTARQDKRVKGLIIKINSPGGMISASDEIFNEILKYRSEIEKPVVAFMQGMATSGGYYVSAACNEIVAEPTTITGSIGVIMGHFVFQELLEEKLGIVPVIFKSGQKKDWPSPFQQPTEEQKQYIRDKLITPAYERFVQIVADGREQLSADQVRELADGSIYGAEEALDEKLIDKIGYLDDAIETAMSLAQLETAQVIEYRKPFSLSNFLRSSAKSFLKIDRSTLYELSTPQLMYLWSLY